MGVNGSFGVSGRMDPVNSVSCKFGRKLIGTCWREDGRVTGSVDASSRVRRNSQEAAKPPSPLPSLCSRGVASFSAPIFLHLWALR